MDGFQWISARPLPHGLDLRRRGWRLAASGAAAARWTVGLVDAAESGLRPEDLAPAHRARAVALGLALSDQRARWLVAGFGDALGPDVGIDELAGRAARVLAGRLGATARRHGRLGLDLVERDARVDGRRLRLNPREFALLWRLADARGASVSRVELLRDVFDLRFDPGTNRLAVHICRLRKKLRQAGLSSLLVTGPGDGAYRLFLDEDDSGPTPAAPQMTLDARPRLGEHALELEELGQ